MNNYTEWERADLAAKIQELEWQIAAAGWLAVCGGCECGVAYVKMPESIDSGTTLTDEKGHKHVIDISSPEQRTKIFADIAAAHTELAQLQLKSAVALRLLEFLTTQRSVELGFVCWPHSKDFTAEVRRLSAPAITVTRKTALESIEAALNAAGAP